MAYRKLATKFVQLPLKRNHLAKENTVHAFHVGAKAEGCLVNFFILNGFADFLKSILNFQFGGTQVFETKAYGIPLFFLAD